MKILYNIGRYNGGAPLSILEYIKIAKKNNNEVLSVGEYSTVEGKYHNHKIKTYNIRYFDYRRPFGNLIGLIKYIKIVKQFRPDIIHATSYGIIPSKFINLLFGIPTLYSIAGGNRASNHIFDKILNNDNVIVYSPENKQSLISLGYNTNKIQIISNRINLGNYKQNLTPYLSFPQKIKLLLISRIDFGVIQSVEYIMDVVDHLADVHENLVLTILGDGVLLNQIKEKAIIINKKHSKNIVLVKGYQDNIRDYIKEAHIVFGKGRSILEPILSNRISYIIGEDKTMSLCTTKSFNYLYNYNFSGRNNEIVSTFDDLSKMIKKINHNRVNVIEIENTRKLTEKYYDIKFAKEKINNIYNSTDLHNPNKGSLSKAIKFIVSYYINKTKRLFNEKIFRKTNDEYGFFKN